MYPEKSDVGQRRELKGRQVLSWFDNWSLLFGYSIFAHERCKYILYWNRFRAITGIIAALVVLVNAARNATSKNYLHLISTISFYITQIQIYGKTTATYFNDCFNAMSLHHQHKIKKIFQLLSCFSILSGSITS